MSEEQQIIIEQMEKQILKVGFTLIQTVTMALSYYKGGYYGNVNDEEFEGIIKTFVEKYM